MSCLLPGRGEDSEGWTKIAASVAWPAALASLMEAFTTQVFVFWSRDLFLNSCGSIVRTLGSLYAIFISRRLLRRCNFVPVIFQIPRLVFLTSGVLTNASYRKLRLLMVGFARVRVVVSARQQRK